MIKYVIWKMTTLSNFILFARGGGGGEIPESYLQSSAKFSRGGGGGRNTQ